MAWGRFSWRDGLYGAPWFKAGPSCRIGSRHGVCADGCAELSPAVQCLADQAWGELERNSQANVSLYARGRDYHKLLRSRLQALGQSLKQHLPGLEFRAFCDSAPVMEVELAHRAKLGWRGKNTLLLNRQSGSMFFSDRCFSIGRLNSFPWHWQGRSKRVKPIRRVIDVEAVALALMSARPRRLLHLIAWMPGAASRI